MLKDLITETDIVTFLNANTVVYLETHMLFIFISLEYTSTWIRTIKECAPCNLISVVLSYIVFWPDNSIRKFFCRILCACPLGKAFCMICGFRLVGP